MVWLGLRCSRRESLGYPPATVYVHQGCKPQALLMWISDWQGMLPCVVSSTAPSAPLVCGGYVCVHTNRQACRHLVDHGLTITVPCIHQAAVPMQPFHVCHPRVEGRTCMSSGVCHPHGHQPAPYGGPTAPTTAYGCSARSVCAVGTDKCCVPAAAAHNARAGTAV
jgi:hypothetical protein